MTDTPVFRLMSFFKTVDRLAQKAPISKPDLASSIGNVSNVVRDDTYNVYYKKYLLADERQTAMYIKTLQDSAITIPWHPEYIEFIEKENGVAFGAQQRMAFSLLKSTGIKILTGGPGTGKTTTVNGLLKYLEMVAESDKELQGLKNMALSAPSGRASQRMAEATGRPASTCHRMIEYAPYGACETYRDEMSPMEANVIVIDEVSMLDISLAKKNTWRLQKRKPSSFCWRYQPAAIRGPRLSTSGYDSKPMHSGGAADRSLQTKGRIANPDQCAENYRRKYSVRTFA